MEEQKIAYCGLNCATCPILIASVKNDDTLRQKIIKELSELYSEDLKKQGIRDLKPEDINCLGCRSDGGRFTGCATCAIRKCCREKELGSCAYCREYEICEVLNGFYSVQENMPAKDNLDRIRSGF